MEKKARITNDDEKNKKIKNTEDQQGELCALPDGILRQLILFLTNDLVTLSNFSMMGKIVRKWANKELKKQLYEYVTKKYGATPLVHCCGLGNLSDCKAMIGIGNYNVNKRNKFGFTALISASLKDHEHVVEYLLQLPNVDINIKNADGGTALSWAIQNGNTKLTKLFCEREHVNVNADVNDEYFFHPSLRENSRYSYAHLRLYRNYGSSALPLPALLTAMNYHRGHNHDKIVKYLVNKFLNKGVTKKHVNDAYMLAHKNGHVLLEEFFCTTLLRFEDKTLCIQRNEPK